MFVYPYNPMLSAYVGPFPLMIGPLFQPFMSVPTKRSDFLNP